MKFSNENYMVKEIDKRLYHIRADVHVQMTNIKEKWWPTRKKKPPQKIVGKSLEVFFYIPKITITSAAASASAEGSTYQMNCISMKIILKGMLIRAVLYSSVGLFHFISFQLVFVVFFLFVCYLLSSRLFWPYCVLFCLAHKRQRNGLHSI